MAGIHQTSKLQTFYDPYLDRAALSEELSGHEYQLLTEIHQTSYDPCLYNGTFSKESSEAVFLVVCDPSMNKL
jgi:hypothetical protein